MHGGGDGRGGRGRGRDVDGAASRCAGANRVESLCVRGVQVVHNADPTLCFPSAASRVVQPGRRGGVHIVRCLSFVTIVYFASLRQKHTTRPVVCNDVHRTLTPANVRPNCWAHARQTEDPPRQSRSSLEDRPTLPQPAQAFRPAFRGRLTASCLPVACPLTFAENRVQPALCRLQQLGVGYLLHAR